MLRHILLTAVIAGVLLSGQGGPKIHDHLIARKFGLVDGQNKLRGVWEVSPKGTASLALLTDERITALYLFANPNGDCAMTFPIKGPEEKDWATFERSARGGPRLDLNDAEGRPRIRLRVKPSTGGATLDFRDDQGRVRFVLGRLDSGRTVLGMQNENGKVRFAGGTTPEGVAELTLLDKDGKIIWQVPEE